MKPFRCIGLWTIVLATSLTLALGNVPLRVDVPIQKSAQAAAPVKPAYTQAPVKEASAKVEIVAPDKVNAGDLVIIDVTGSTAKSYKWVISPATEEVKKNFLVIDGGKRAVFSHGRTGDFVFTVAVAVGDTVDVQVHNLKVIGNEPAGELSLSDRIDVWCEKVESSDKRDEAMKLSQSFASVSIMLTDEMLTPEIIEATTKSNRAAIGASITNWTPFFEGIRDVLNEKGKAGELQTVEDHRQLWLQISDGLKRYANTL